MRVSLLPILVAVLVLLVGRSLRANHPVQSPVIYDTFRDFDGGYDPIYGFFVNDGEPVASAFVTPAGGPFRLERVDLALQANTNAGPGFGSVRVSLRPGLSRPGSTVLDAVERYDIPQSPRTFAEGTQSFEWTRRPMLQPSTTYWVVVEDLTGGTIRPFWHLTQLDQHAATAEFRDGGWFLYQTGPVTTAMRVVAPAVPEPRTLLFVVVMVGTTLLRPQKAERPAFAGRRAGG